MTRTADSALRAVRGGALVALATALVGAGASPAAPTWIAPAELVGDGTTTARLVLRLAPGDDPDDLVLTASGGRLGEPRVAEGGAVVAELVAPRVADEVPLQVEAALRDGRRSTATVRVVPPPFAPATGGARPNAISMPAAVLVGSEPVVVTVPASGGAPPRLRASTGEPGPFAVDGDRLVATLALPAERHPQAAIVALTSADGALVDWAPLVLVARAVITTGTKAFAAVTNTFGGASYGPLRADRTGAARIAVLVPPGVREGTTHAVDRHGNERHSTFALGTRRFARMLVVCGDTLDRVWVLAIDEAGRPGGAEPVLRARAGDLGELRELAPGTWEARFSAPRGLDAGAAISFHAVDAADPESSAGCVAHHPGDWPEAIAVEPARRAFVAGEGGLPVRITLQYPGTGGGRAVDVSVEPSFGTATRARAADTPGRLEATWRLPAALEGRTEATLVARSSTGLVARARIELRPGPIARLEPSADATRVIADGTRTTAVSVRAWDAFGNAVPSFDVEADAAGGRVSDLRPAADGVSRGAYTPAPVEVEGSDVLSFRADAASAAMRLVVAPPPARLVGTARVGWISNFGRVSAPLLLFGADARPRPDGSVLAGLRAGFYRSRERREDASGTEAVEVGVDAVPVLARLAWERAFSSRWLATAAAGGGAVVARTEVSAPSAGHVGATVVVPAFAAELSLQLDTGRGGFVGEVGWWHAALREGPATGNAGGLVLMGGYRREL